MPEPNKKFLLLSNPRTCSNLFIRLLHLENQDPNVSFSGNHFVGTGWRMLSEGLLDKRLEEWTDEDGKGIYENYEYCLWWLLRDEVEGGKEGVVVVKEHADTIINPMKLVAYAMGREGQEEEEEWTWDIEGEEKERSGGNLTIFPHAYLLSWTPIFLIRHPGRAYESLCRASADVGRVVGASEGALERLNEMHMTLRWMRSVYAFYTSQGITPMIVDADDMLLHTRDIMEKVAEFIGLDKTLLKFDWVEATEEETTAQGRVLGRMLETLNKSRRVEVEETKLGRSFEGVEKEGERWRREFGDEVTEKLGRWVEGALDDFVWLRERRTRP